MGHMSGVAKVQNTLSKSGSKRQQWLKENARPQQVVACKCCHATGITLYKAVDSYYCKFCFDKLNKEKFNKEK